MVKGTPLAKWGPHSFIVVVVSVVVGVVVNFGVIIIIIIFNYTLIHVLIDRLSHYVSPNVEISIEINNKMCLVFNKIIHVKLFFIIYYFHFVLVLITTWTRVQC